jgi:hypothetical protein
MKPTTSDPTTWDLAENAAARVSRARTAVLVRVERGTVMVTREGDLEDHVLERGDELLLPAGRLAVAWAFTPARLSVRGAGGRTPAPPSLVGPPAAAP